MAAARNVYRVPKKQWMKWSPRARHTFNRVYSWIKHNQSLTIHPKAKTATTRDPLYSTYLIKKVDRNTWANMVNRAKSEGRSLSGLFHEWIRKYADGE